VPRDELVPEQVPAGAPHYNARLLARLARGIADGEDVTPNFATAAESHRLLEAVQRASDTGQKVSLPS
jgi:predicted dehydrogenase